VEVIADIVRNQRKTESAYPGPEGPGLRRQILISWARCSSLSFAASIACRVSKAVAHPQARPLRSSPPAAGPVCRFRRWQTPWSF
jgi:hypothetical protein